ncbi:MAG: hypothetical protein HY758_10830 [Nitrospirae bacterium]|nr:hypothetical protein [Nitrospirota bacterium]
MKSGPLKIFFSGIAGSGVSAIAGFMADSGNIIAGSDRAFDINPSHPLKQILLSRGITIVPQDGSGIDNTFDLAVFSTAVEADQPEVLKAGKLNIPVKTRPEYLTEIMSFYKAIAVAGTSGKSTTSGLLAFLMQRLGYSPGFIGGGKVKQFRSPSNPGNSISGNSEYLVVEACESDGSIVNYRPEHSMILNLSLDHHTVDKTAAMFRALIENTGGRVIVNADDKNLKDVTGNNSITFSIQKTSDYKADRIIYRDFSTDFSLHGTDFRVSLPGAHNLSNALSCIALLADMGMSLSSIASVLHEFEGIERRFDVHLNTKDYLVIDDYAHNPHKIFSLMQTVRNLRERICYIFQPHGFGPTRLMKEEYIRVFADNLRSSDRLMLLPIFYAGGTAAKDISSQDLADGIRTAGKPVEAVNDRKDILKGPSEYQAYVVFGARDDTLSDLAKEIAQALG